MIIKLRDPQVAEDMPPHLSKGAAHPEVLDSDPPPVKHRPYPVLNVLTRPPQLHPVPHEFFEPPQRLRRNIATGEVIQA